MWERCWCEPIRENFRHMRAEREKLDPGIRAIMDALAPIPDPDEV